MKNRSALPVKALRHRLFGSVSPIAGNKPTTKEMMADLQNKRENYLFPIDRVGICKVRHPIQVDSQLPPHIQTSIATMELKTSLGQNAKGINMSRLTEHVEHFRQRGLSAELSELGDFVRELAERMEQEQAEVVLSFPWFYERSAPHSGISGLNHSEVTMTVAYEQGKPLTASIGMQVTVTTLCPCSKEISEYSAHNQRGIVSMTVVIDPASAASQDWKARLLDAAESNASSPLHPILKRPDEKQTTEKAYENPRFVEDMVRLVAADLYEMEDVLSFQVECRNEESIHLHDAIATITYDKKKAAPLL